MRGERDVVLHSWCVQTDWNAPTVVGGRGARLQLQDGREVLDMSSLSECSNLGHQHPRMVAAIREQAAQLCFVTSAWGAKPRADLAERLLELAGFEDGRVYFTLSGADANENAVKIARQASKKPRGTIITRDRSYHGATYMAMALSGDSRTQQQVSAAQWCVRHVPPPYAYRCPFGSRDAEECGRLAAQAVAEAIDSDGAASAGAANAGAANLGAANAAVADAGAARVGAAKVGASNVAAVLMEANAGTNGIVAPDNYWPALRKITAERGVCLIADEVMSGFGRCGEWFAWQRHGDAGKPDLITMAKGLTGGAMPLAAVALSREIAGRIENEMLYTGLTYCGHPLACAAGLAALDTYRDENLVARSRSLGARMLEELRKLQQRHAVIGDVRGGSGLFAVVELVADRATREPLAAWPATPAPLASLLKAAMESGISFASRGNLLLLAPPLVIEEQELAEALGTLDKLLARFFPGGSAS